MAEISTATTKRKRGPGRPWAKGQSGNPGGRPAVDQDVRDMLKAATPAAAKLLIDTMQDPDCKIDVRLDAARTVMDRVYGKATQPIDGNIDGKILLSLAPDLDDFAG